MITGVDLLRGLAVLLGWDVREVEGMTSFHDTNYAGQGKATVRRAGSTTTWSSRTSKRRTRHRTRPTGRRRSRRSSTSTATSSARCWRSCDTFDEWRILVMPDHPTNIATRKHGYAPPPFAMAGTRVRGVRQLPYSEPTPPRAI